MRAPTSRRRAATVLALLFTLAAFPLGTAAIHQFTDVPNTNIFHADISAVADAGVTTGCGGSNYCPSAFVTREQMAAFMNRLGALAAGKTPVVNATTVDRYSANELNRVAFNQTNGLISGTDTAGTLSVTIYVPAEGYLLIWGNAQLSNLTSDSNVHGACSLRVDPVMGTSLPGSYQEASVGYYSGLENWAQQCTTQAVAQVCAAGEQVVDMDVTLTSSVADVGAATLIVEYVPFGSNGNLPVCVG